jgi:hypothetical protein
MLQLVIKASTVYSAIAHAHRHGVRLTSWRQRADYPEVHATCNPDQRANVVSWFAEERRGQYGYLPGTLLWYGDVHSAAAVSAAVEAAGKVRHA